MPGETDLSQLLKSLKPILTDEAFVFCTVPASSENYLAWDPISTFLESEGRSLILTKRQADDAGLPYEAVFRQITLSVHSSLSAVGLTAEISSQLARRSISANVVAAYHHDHVYVPAERADEALTLLEELGK